MRFSDIKRHLKPYSIIASRTTTINHAFAAAVAPNDPFDVNKIRAALELLGQNPDDELTCAYCGQAAETWDHIHGTVKNKVFSGYGHRIGNLLPCCKPCNSKKGNKDWLSYLKGLKTTDEDRLKKEHTINNYITKYCSKDVIPQHLGEYQKLQLIKQEVIDLLAKADSLAAIVRNKSKTD
ncbi:MAG: hypothetical protein WCD70_12390 [Alphaproteobacteria bacterium]